MKVKEICIADLKDGLVLGEDLCVENKLLLKKGCTLSEKIISLLEKRNVQFVSIQSDELEHHQAENLLIHEKVVESERNFNSEDTSYKSNYLEALEGLSSEILYGHALKDMEDILNAWDLYINIRGFNELK